MPGKDWRPVGRESNGVQPKAPAVVPRESRLSAAKVDDEITNLEMAYALDTSIRLSRAKACPAEAQSTPNLISPAFVFSVGSRVIYSGNIWRFVVSVLASVLVGASLLAYSMASTLLTFSCLVGLLFVIPCTVGVLAHTGRLTDD
jgi:hypothetical protein